MYFKTIWVFATMLNSRSMRENFCFLFEYDFWSSSEFDFWFFFVFDSWFSFIFDSWSSRRFDDNDKRIENNKELKENAKLKDERQSKSIEELINNELLKRLWWLREDERRDLMIDEVIKMKELKREFLDVCELSKVRREVLALEKENEEFILLVNLFILLIYELCFMKMWCYSIDFDIYSDYFLITNQKKFESTLRLMIVIA
jgi:hypothetical protein